MNNRALHIIIYITGFVCLCIFLAARFPVLFNLMVREKVVPEYWENTPYGELYNFNRISHFKENLPPSTVKYRHTPKCPPLQDADILIFGDSFFDFTRLTTFPERLGDTLDKRVFYSRYDYPLNTLAESQYPKGQSRILIYETAERYIPERFSTPQVRTWEPDTRSNLRKKLANLWHLVFLKDSEVRYSLLLTRSYLTQKIYELVATFKFDHFGYIAETTPVYSLKYDIPWLFYFEEVNKDKTSFYYHHTDQEIERYCDNIADLRKKLKEAYNLEMVFMPVPCKYTVYHTLVNDDAYNNLLPRIYAGLDARDVPVVKVFDQIMNSREVLYYGTDTHWNKKGLDLVLNETVSFLNKIDTGFIAGDKIHDNSNKN